MALLELLSTLLIVFLGLFKTTLLNLHCVSDFFTILMEKTKISFILLFEKVTWRKDERRNIVLTTREVLISFLNNFLVGFNIYKQL